jgi:hypothetical protein
MINETAIAILPGNCESQPAVLNSLSTGTVDKLDIQ